MYQRVTRTCSVCSTVIVNVHTAVKYCDDCHAAGRVTRTVECTICEKATHQTTYLNKKGRYVWPRRWHPECHREREKLRWREKQDASLWQGMPYAQRLEIAHTIRLDGPDLATFVHGREYVEKVMADPELRGVAEGYAVATLPAHQRNQDHQLDVGPQEERPACFQTEEDFFPGGSWTDHEEQAQKLWALCGSCPVRRACAEHAIRHEDYGIWAGLTERQREELRSKNSSARGRVLHMIEKGERPCHT